jgi:ribosomal protein L22
MTEKNYNPEQKQVKAMKKQQAASGQKIEAPKKEDKVEDKKTEIETNAEEKKTEKETKKEKTKPKVKKHDAVVNGISLPISTKDSVAICRFIMRKTIDKAISDLEEVQNFKRAIPMTGEIPHRKGKGMMSGRYMTKPVGFFIKMLKNLQANANVNGLEEPVIVEAVPNRASRPYGRFGSVKRKRTHVKIRVMEKAKLKSKEKKK